MPPPAMPVAVGKQMLAPATAASAEVRVPCRPENAVLYSTASVGASCAGSCVRTIHFNQLPVEAAAWHWQGVAAAVG